MLHGCRALRDFDKVSFKCYMRKVSLLLLLQVAVAMLISGKPSASLQFIQNSFVREAYY